jgi:hypothetical protein
MDTFKISAENITIKFLQINGKKLTRSVYTQIENKRFFDKQVGFIGDQVLGYVLDKTDKVLIWSQKGMLRKTILTPYFKLRKSSPYLSAEKAEWFLLLADIKYTLSDDGNFNEIVNDVADYDRKVEKVKAFLDQITDDMQIFI